MCAERVGGKGGNFWREADAGEEGQYLLNSPRSAGSLRLGLLVRPAYSLHLQPPLAGYQGCPPHEPLLPSLLPSGL